MENRAPPRHGGASFEQKTPASSVTTTARQIFDVHFEHSGLRRIVNVTRTIYASKDRQLANLLPENLLLYIASLCLYNRWVQLTVRKAAVFVQGASWLNKATENIKLPNAIVDYIESIGDVEMANGCVVTPVNCAATLAQTLQRTRPAPEGQRPRARQAADAIEYFDHRALIDDLQEWVDNVVNQERNFNGEPFEIQGIEAQVQQPDADWGIVPYYINMYHRVNLRLDKVFLPCRSVDNSIIEGKENFLCAYLPTDYPDQIKPTAPQRMLQAVAQMGACYAWRRGDHATWYPANGNHLLRGNNHDTTFICCSLHLSQTVTRSLADR